MTARELANLIDKQATLTLTLNADPRAERCTIGVTILDARTAYGNEQVLITPVAGTGQAWVSVDRVKVKGENDGRQDKARVRANAREYPHDASGGR